MVFVKRLILFVLFGAFLSQESYAVHTPKKKPSATEDIQKTPPKVPLFSPLKRNSPNTEKKYFSPLRKQMCRFKANGPVPSPKVRQAYRDLEPDGYWSRKIIFKKRRFLQADHLFDPEAKVYTKTKEIETNLDRMKRGLCPIGHQGIIAPENFEEMSLKAVLRQQKKWRIELQHVTQKESNPEEDPLCEMTHTAHMGKNARIVYRIDPKTEEIIILGSSLDKENALLLKQHEGAQMMTNLLHFRKGKSLISRKVFKKVRKFYWENRAQQIEEGEFHYKMTETITPRKLFPIKEDLSGEVHQLASLEK